MRKFLFLFLLLFADEEALRVIKSISPWKPGKQNGKAVRTMFTLPIAFSLK